MKQILVVCPVSRDRRELLSLGLDHSYSYIFHNFTSDNLKKLIFEDANEPGKMDDILTIIDHLIKTYRDEKLAGVISSDDYPGAIIASILAHALKLQGPHPELVLLCQHKYYSRLAQKKYVPHAVPNFVLVDPFSLDQHADPPLPFPFFLKPVKSFLSCFATTISSHAELLVSKKNFPPAEFLEPFNMLLKKHTKLQYNSDYFIAEELLKGHQATIEGYVYQGDIHILGIVDSIMYPGTISFERFIYPSSLPQDVQERMSSIAAQCMQGIGFDNGMFNIEFFYDPIEDSLKIIEINPRIANQFADLYEKVDGFNSYDILLAIATGEKPKLKKRQGAYKLAASCVLRMFENKIAVNVPDESCIKKIQNKFPGARIEVLAHRGNRLSNELQDGKSYRYCILQLGAKDNQDLETKISQCVKEMNFQFENIS